MKTVRICFLLGWVALGWEALAQSPAGAVPGPAVPRPVGPRGYAGVQVRVPGIFVTPVANEPFTATVKIVSHQKLADGSEHVVTSINHVARRSSGMIYNERRQLVPASFQGEPRLLSTHIYDPSSRLSITTEPAKRLAREQILPHAPATAPGPTVVGPKLPGTVETDLGTQQMNGVELRGLRRERTIAAELSGTGKPVVITDDYWFAPQLSIYLIVRHDDPRTGEQLIAVTDVDAHEPDANLFVVPASYKVLDETPPPPEPGSQGGRPQ